MKKFISLAIVLALVISLAAMPVSAASFTDTMGEGNRFYNAVKYVEDTGIFLESDMEGDTNAWLEGDATRIEYATWLARFAGADLNTAAAQAEGATYVLDATNDLAAMSAGAKADGETELVGNYFTVHYGAKTKIDSSSKTFADGYKAAQRLNFQGKTVFGDTVSYAISFTTSAAASVKIWWVAGDAGRQFYLFDENGTKLSGTSDELAKNDLCISELSVDAAGTYYLGLVEGSNYLFKLEVAEEAASAGTELPFSDMEEYAGTEGYAAVAWGVANGYIKGYTDNTFRPEREISREEICAMFARYMRANDWLGLNPTDNITVFMDQDEFSAYTIEEQNVADCVRYGLIQGRETGRFDAKHVCDGETVYTTRYQMAAIFYRAAGHQIHTTRAYFEAAAGNGTILSVRVNMHYTAVVKVSDATVNTANISVKGSALSHSLNKSFSTGMSENLELRTFLSNAFTFEGATIAADIAGVAVTYNVWPAFIDEKDGMTTIAFLPDDVASIEAAWDTVSAAATQTSGEGSYVILTNGSSIQIGEQVAEFNRGKSDWTLDNFSDTDTLRNEFEEYIKIDTDSDAKIELILEKGLTVAAKGRVGTLNEDLTITMEGIYAYELGDAIVALLDENADLQTAGLDLIDAINELFGDMSGNHDMTLTVEIG